MQQQFEVTSTQDTFWALHRKLLGGTEPFVYTRYGDGELEIMLGGGGGNQLPDPKLAQETWDLFHNKDPRNMLALARHKNEEGMRPGMFEAWHDPKYKFADVPRRFENAIALHYNAVFKPQLLSMLFERIRHRPKTYVGGLYLPQLEDVWGAFSYVRVPEFNSYSAMQDWYERDLVYQVDVASVHCNKELPLILVAAGPAKCAAALRLLNSGRMVQFVDLGSVVDLLLKVPSRTWIREALA